MSHLACSWSHVCWDWESGTLSCVTLGVPSASLGFCFFILPSQGHGKPGNYCHDFKKLQVQNGDEEGATGLGDPGHKGWPACPATTFQCALVHSFCPIPGGSDVIMSLGAVFPGRRRGCRSLFHCLFGKKCPLSALWELPW